VKRLRLAAVLLALALATACGVSAGVSRQLGARRDHNAECDDRCLTGGQFPDGLCSLDCEQDDDCPDGSACADLEGGVCLFSCQADPDCDFLGAGWRCHDQPERGGGGPVSVCIGG
jgi:hypothetical protein